MEYALKSSMYIILKFIQVLSPDFGGKHRFSWKYYWLSRRFSIIIVNKASQRFQILIDMSSIYQAAAGIKRFDEK